MDALRTLSLAFLSTVASTPAFAQTFNATSGSMVIGSGDFFGTPYTFAGTDFSPRACLKLTRWRIHCFYPSVRDPSTSNSSVIPRPRVSLCR